MKIKVDALDVLITSGRDELGKLAAAHVASLIRSCLGEKDEARMVFAAAPSQNEFLAALSSDNSIEWNKIVGFHMDEYLNLPPGSPQLFSEYLNAHFFSKVSLKNVHLLRSKTNDPAGECRRYAQLIGQKPIDIVCMGIGENGHIAFNDPPVADFRDPELVKVVELDTACRQQQVNDGCFPDITKVPHHAITLTIPALFSARSLSIAVPGIRKATAVQRTLYEKVSTDCPATIVRTHRNATLFIDDQSSSLVHKESR